MNEMQGRDQSYARTLNNELVLKELRNGDYSATELADFLSLSNAAMSSILKGLINDGLIKVSCYISKAGKGRKQVRYTLNEEFGLIIVVSLSDNRYHITISNIKEEILLEAEKEIDKYDIAMIYEIVLFIKDTLASLEYRDIPLRQIIVAVPGCVNSQTGELQLSKQFDRDLFDGKNNIKSIFENAFSIPVSMQNDINLSIIGEMKYGCLANVRNALLAYVDNGLGGAMVLNGKFYGGDCGYAGEIGLITTTFKNKKNVLDEFVSLRSIKEYFSKKNGKHYKVALLSEEYKKKGEVYEYVNETAHLLGEKLRDIVELLNISHIVLAGRVSLFGEDYLNCLKEELKSTRNPCEIKFTQLSKRSTLYGAITVSVDSSINHSERILL